MSVKARFGLGLAVGALSSGITYAIPAVQAYWLPVGAVCACLVWFGEYIGEFFN